jgi:shikimate kinase
MNRKNIVLVGFMGTGKTTVGRQLSEELKMPLLDMDSMLVERTGKSINEIFAEEGEPHFRELERYLSIELAATSGNIISTGGGIVLNPENIRNFERTGLVVCLQALPEEILNRIRHDDSRPLLADDKASKIMELLESRKPLYGAIPFQIQTDKLTPETISHLIIEKYQSLES